MAHAPRQEAHYVTPAEYDQLELESGIKYEWFSGEVFPLGGYAHAMAGARPVHNIIAAQALAQLVNQLDDQPCDARGSDQRVKIEAHDAITYPDIVVACPPHEYDERHTTALFNPRVIIEILSPSTEKRDRNEKFAMFRSVASLKHYILIASEYKSIEHFERDGERWIYNVAHKDDDCITLSDLNCHLCVRDVYKRLDLPSATMNFERSE